MLVEAEFITRTEGNIGGNSAFTVEINGWRRLFSKQYVDRTFVGILMMFFQRTFSIRFSLRFPSIHQYLFLITEWSGINALLYYGPLLMHRIGFEGETTELIGSGLVNIIQLLAAIPAIIYIDRLGTSGFLMHSL